MERRGNNLTWTWLNAKAIKNPISQKKFWELKSSKTKSNPPKIPTFNFINLTFHSSSPISLIYCSNHQIHTLVSHTYDRNKLKDGITTPCLLKIYNQLLIIQIKIHSNIPRTQITITVRYLILNFKKKTSPYKKHSHLLLSHLNILIVIKLWRLRHNRVRYVGNIRLNKYRKR